MKSNKSIWQNIFWPKSIFSNFKNGQKSIFVLRKCLTCRENTRQAKSRIEFRNFKKPFLAKHLGMMGGTFDPKGHTREMGTWAHSSGPMFEKWPKMEIFVRFRIWPKWVQNVQKNVPIQFSTFQLLDFCFKWVISDLKNLTRGKI